MLQGPRETVERSRRLRKEMSLPEVLLWQELRKRPAGLKFRAQHPAGPYTADFFCHQARLVIEIDGEAHDRGDRPQRDEVRDTWFEEQRFRTLRIPAVEILRNLEGVMRGIVDAANPPLKGEGDQPKAGGGVSALGDRAEAAPAEGPTPLRRAGARLLPSKGRIG